MADIRVNDIFQELIEENTKITECLNVLIRFKTFIDLIFDKLKTNLDSNALGMFEDFNREVEDVFKRNKMDFSVTKEHNRRKTQLFDFLSSKPQTSDANSLQLSLKSNNQSIDSMKIKYKGVKPRLLLKKKTLSSGKSLNQRTIKSEDKDLMDENERYVCSFVGCGQRLKNRDSLRSHQRMHSENPKPYQCDFEGCGYATRSKIELRDHINAHKGIKPFGCDFCEKRFSSERYLKQHINIRHKVTDQMLICELDECYKQFKSELSFRNHQRFHLREKRFACEEPNCNYKTIHASLLKQHVSKVHSEYRPFVCEIDGCSKAYKTNNELRIHIQCHSSERKYKCLFEGCDKAFKTAQNLRKHTILHSDVELRCDWPGCEYTTKNVMCLRSHQGIHSSERNFLCDWPQCGKRFKNKHRLETHLRIHKSDKRYACSWPGCLYRCTDSGNLIKHRRVHIRN